MSSHTRELVFLILQILDDEKFKETVHKLEQESGIFFNMRHFEDLVTNGEWEEVEKYLSGFTKVDDNQFSTMIFFEIRKQKYLEALDKQELVKAVAILVKDLKVFATFDEEIFKEMTQLLTLKNFRENENLSAYVDTKSARRTLLTALKNLIEANPLFHDKLQFPTLKNSRLRTLMNQRNWQHRLCQNPRPNPYGHDPFQPTPAALPSYLASWMANPSPVPHPSDSAGPVSLNTGYTADNAMMNRTQIHPYNTATDLTSDFEHALKRLRPVGLTEEVDNLPVHMMPLLYGNQSSYSSEDLPKNVVATLDQGSAVKSMDFHPVQQILLLVGTIMGDVMIWEVGTRERVALRNFEVWELEECSISLQASLANDYTASINRVMWSRDGALFGVAYSKHIVHLYAYTEGDDLRNHLEIEAHVGNVYDIAFAYPNNQLFVVTCGEDRVIKVWDAITGLKQYTFEGHEAPVYSVYPHQRSCIPFIFSTAADGKIKAWLYDDVVSRIDCDAPGLSLTTMSYSADGRRLFSCGTNKEGDSFLVEWNEREGAVKRTYHGLAKQSAGVVQFETIKNRFLAAGDDFLVKFWDMDYPNPLMSINANGGLPGSPSIKFHKDGILLAVSTNDNGIKILANRDGIELLKTIENRSFNVPRPASAADVQPPTIGTINAVNMTVGTSIEDRTSRVATLDEMLQNSDGQSRVNVEPRVTEDPVEKSRSWKITEINEPSQCHSLKLPDNLQAQTVLRLIYRNSGRAILALASNAVHKVWKWQRSEGNLTGKATANVAPQLWKPSSGISMTNVMSDSTSENAVPCFALSKNDCYLVSASGGDISLFNMFTFKSMRTFMPPPPAATFLAFHPHDNNIVAIGLDDSTVQIYNIRFLEPKIKLKGHRKRITGLAFSNILNVLVSSGADSQLCVWSTDKWKKQASKFLKIPNNRSVAPLANTYVQFHSDQTQLLAIHETQIAIFEAPILKCLKQWVPQEGSGPITHATYSCDNFSIYVSFGDGSVHVLTASTLRLRCRVNQTAYLPSNPRVRDYPLAIAAHPSKPDQFAIGLTDGGVHVLEPLESDGRWGTSSPTENGAQSTSSRATGSEGRLSCAA